MTAAPASDPRTALREKLGAVAPDVLMARPVTFSISVEGLEGTGKSRFCLSMPRPLVLVNFGDRDPTVLLYELTEEQREGIQPIYNIQPSSEEGWTYAEALMGLQKLGEIIKAEGPYMPGGTFVLDGGSSWWSVMQQVFVEPKEKAREAQGKKQVGGIIYEEANGRARGLLGYLKSIGCFLAITHQLKQDWDASGPIPFRYSAKRNSQVPYIVEVVVRMLKVCATCGAMACSNDDGQHVGRIHKARIEKFAGNTGLEGMIVDNLDFAKLYSLYAGKEYVAQ